MTKERAREWLPLLQGIADGKEIEFCVCPTVWVSCPGFDMNQSPEVYRIKPIPKLRPWRCAAAVPMPCAVRKKESDPACVWTVFSAFSLGVGILGGHGFESKCTPVAHGIEFQKLLDRFEHSTDGGKTWKPCGMEE